MMYTMMNTYKTTMLLYVNYASIKKKYPQQIVLKIWNRRHCQTPFTLWLLGAYYVLLSVQGYEESLINQIKVVPALFWLYHWWNSAPLLLWMFIPQLRFASFFYRPCWHCLNLWIQKLLSDIGTECLHFNRKIFFSCFILFGVKLDTGRFPNASK